MNEAQQLGTLPIEYDITRQPPVVPIEMPERAVLLCVAEDVTSARNGVAAALRRAGFEVDLLEISLAKLPDVQAKPYRVVVFDINKANSISFDVVRRIRELSVIPIMLVLHGMARNDILRGFQVGADAYVLAPFDEREFGARIRALLQRIPVRSKAV